MSILGWVLAWCGSALKTEDFGTEINKELSFIVLAFLDVDFTPLKQVLASLHLR